MIRDPQTWKAVASQLSSSVPFVSEALNVIPLIATTRVPYAGTDGKSILFNPESWGDMWDHLEATGNAYPTQQACIATVLLHECYHIILKHGKRGLGVPRRKLWSKAVDIATNNYLVDTFTLPPFQYHGEKMAQYKKALAESGTFDERFRNRDTESIYNTLCDEEPEDEEDNESTTTISVNMSGAGGEGDQQGESKPDPNGESEGGGDGSSDEKNDQQDNDNGSGGSGDKDDEQTGDQPKPEPQQKPLDNEMSEDADSGVPDDVEELINNAMSDYLERNAQYAPSGSGLAHEIKEAKKKPPILMSHILRKIRDVISGTIFDYRKPSRMDSFSVLMGSEGRMPSYHDDPSDKVRQLVIALDESGSMGELERQTAFALARDAFKNVKREIRLLVFTDRVVQDEIITKDTVLHSRHSGGTHIACLMDYLDNPTKNPDPRYNRPIKPSAIVIITDGYDPMSMPLLERWKYKNRMRNIVIGTKMEMPGLTFHCDAVDGYPRS